MILASRDLNLISHTPIGRSQEHLRLVVADQKENQQTVLWWNGVGNPLPGAEATFDLAYKIQASTYRGERQLQIQWVDFRAITEPDQKTPVEISTWNMMDFREQPHPLEKLQAIQAEQDLQIWAEGEAKTRLRGLDRNELAPGSALAVWTTPPGPQEWRAVLEQVAPSQIYLFAIDPHMDEARAFLGRLAGLTKFALRTKKGEIDLAVVAAATAQRQNTVRMGLLWLEAKGLITIARREEGIFWLETGMGGEDESLAEITRELKSMLEESAAYRAYFKATTENNFSD